MSRWFTRRLGGTEFRERVVEIDVNLTIVDAMLAYMETNDITAHIVDAAYQIHRDVGPGLFEKVYEVLLADALTEKGLKVARQVGGPI